MNRETALAIGSLAVLAVIVLGVLVVPGVMAESDASVRPSDLDLRSEAPPAILDVGGDTVTLRIDTRLLHRGGPGKNVTLEVRAVDAETGLLADRVVRSVGTITGDRERRVLTNLTLDREGGYRIETILYEDGRRIERGSRRVSGVGSLTPAYARSQVKFQRFETLGADLPTITYGVESTDSGRATLRVSAALTNTGGEPAGDVELVLRARQAESNVVADRTTVDVSEIRPGRTVSPSAELTVPDGYNYWLDAMLVSDGAVVDTAVEPANLDPKRTLTRNRTSEEVAFNASDFDRGSDGREDESREERTPTSGSGPGFGVAVVLVAVIASLWLAVRRDPV